ncbi:biliverdin-producing heme oxygenase [Sphingobacterium daejeonense]|uniref:Biliverdin-producing heme oxygenase n=1 Tax=Sphingobacterium daejeonense TaxID=371142 RepID=A0ABW3RP47_9SPHI
MLSTLIKEQTKSAHQQVESNIVRHIKKIENEADYAELLKGFYAYFKAVEDETGKFITTEVLPDKDNRRNSSYIERDIKSLGHDLSNLPQAIAPTVHSELEALSSLYVLEGSIMGGPYIVQMLRKIGIERGFSFFEGYGDQSEAMWTGFTEVLNRFGDDSNQHDRAIELANQTFYNFGNVFQKENSLQ